MKGMQGVTGLLPLVALIIIFYFLLIRPQKKKEKAVNAMRNALKVGDEIVTIGGICGKVMKVKEESITIAVGADKTKFEVMKWAVSNVVTEAASTSSDASETTVSDEESDEENVQVRKSLPKKIKKKETTAMAEEDSDTVEDEGNLDSDENTKE